MSADHQTALLEQYKLVREHIALTVQDRHANNRLLLAILSILLGAEGYVMKDVVAASRFSLSPAALGLLLFASLFGAVLSALWCHWNRSYELSLSVRYDLLREMETGLPAQPFKRELELRAQRRYTPIATVIGGLSALFFAAYVLSLIVLVTYAVVRCA